MNVSGIKRTALLITIVLLSCLAGCASSAKPPADYTWERTGDSLALIKAGHTIWQLNYDKRYDKPYFYPVALADGTTLTERRPADHPWHRSLWWSWKFINGVNYWEDDPNTFLAPGRNEIMDVSVKPHEDGFAEATITISYHPQGKSEVMTEKRTLRMSAPDVRGIYCIDWKSDFTAKDKDLLLDRTPIRGEQNGVEWGGYTGLSIRLAQNAGGWQAADSEGHTFGEGYNNAKGRWLDFTIEPNRGVTAGIAVLDHPDNLRHPTPWDVILGQGKKGMRYFSPAILYYEPLTLPSGKTLTLRYRIIIHPGGTNRDILESEWQKFSKSGKW
jgi:hypothetical protein